MGDSFGEGRPDGVPYELPVHTVTVDSFYMGRCEVTNRQYCDYLNSALSQKLITVISGGGGRGGLSSRLRYEICYCGKQTVYTA